MLLFCISFLTGVLAILTIEALIFHLWLSKQNKISTPTHDEITADWGHITDVLKSINSGLHLTSTQNFGKNTASFLNVVMLFLFQELRDDTKVRAQVLSRINHEISEILTSKLKSRIIKTLSVHNFSAGMSPPKLSNIHISKLKMCDETKLFRKLHISVDIDYKGCGKLALEATTFLGKNMYISVEVAKLMGKLIFIFNRDPQTHWGFCFDSEPEVEFNVISAFQQRSLPKLTKVVTSILKHAIRKKHTKPRYKRRYSPFFKEPFISLPPERQFFICREPLNQGKLIVKLISANRVVKIAGKKSWFYCTVSLGAKMWDAECCPLKQSISFDTVIPNVSGGIGITFNVESDQDLGDCPRVVVEDVQRNSPASESNIRQGDIITAINNKKASSFKTVLAASLAANRAKLSLKRPLLKWNKIFTSSGEASQDMAAFQADAVKDATFVEEEEFLILKELELEDEEIPGESVAAETVKPHCGENAGQPCHNNAECLLRTQYCSESIAPFWDEYFLLKMQESQQYLTVCLWKEEAPTRWPTNPVLVGFCNVNLADIVLQCIATSSNTYNESATLRLPSNLKWQENIVPPIGSLPQIIPKMECIAGEVKLQLTYCTADKEFCEHSFAVGQTQVSEKCSVCGKRIVHKTAYICTLCSNVRHEKCLHTDPSVAPPRRSTALSRKRNSPLLRQRSHTIHTARNLQHSSDSNSFPFLRGSEKKAALFGGKLQDIENNLREKIALRKSLLGAKARCQQVPATIQDQLTESEDSIKNLINLKEQLLR